MSSSIRGALQFPECDRDFLAPRLPSTPLPDSSDYPFTTLTFATSLDSSLSLSPGAQTVLSGAETKALTHYLRSVHDAILVGVGTAVADNPSLNCRLEGVGGYGGEGLQGQPRPIVVDPELRWNFEEGSCKLLTLVKEGKGKAPWIVTALSTGSISQEKRNRLETAGGRFITANPVSGVEEGKKKLDWKDILAALAAEGIKSVMVEGGGGVINALLQPQNSHLINSVIVTIAPVWLGQGGVVVSPERRIDEKGNPMAALRLKDVEWKQFGEDVVMSGKIK